MLQPTLIAVICFTLFLVVVLLKAGYGISSDILQNRSTNKRQLAAENAASQELSSRLKQTYIDLSLSRRQIRWREVMVAKVIMESEDVRSFYLVDQEFEPLPSALPGQHVLVERPKQADSEGGFRCYSLSDDCTTGHWRISVKRNSEKPQSVSRWLHEEIVVGDILKVRGPSGSFYLQPTANRNVVCVSAGIGITPMLPMLMESIRRPCGAIYCFAQFRDVAHMPFADSLLSLAAKFQQVSMNIWISRLPEGVRKSTQGMFFEGKFQARNLLCHTGALDHSDYYLCGPEEWQDRIRTELIESGVPSKSVRYELFHQTEKPPTSTTDPVQHNVLFRQSGANARFESSHCSLLVCAGKNKVSLESGCRTGACGSCAVKLLCGKVRYTREPQFDMQSNEILPCVCVPESDLEVDA